MKNTKIFVWIVANEQNQIRLGQVDSTTFGVDSYLEILQGKC